mgnify:CR=1 FL=1
MAKTSFRYSFLISSWVDDREEMRSSKENMNLIAWIMGFWTTVKSEESKTVSELYLKYL